MKIRLLGWEYVVHKGDVLLFLSILAWVITVGIVFLLVQSLMSLLA